MGKSMTVLESLISQKYDMKLNGNFDSRHGVGLGILHELWEAGYIQDQLKAI